MSHKVVYFEVIGKDAAKLQKFYRGLFGWAIKADNPIQYGEVAASNAGIGGAIGQTDRPAGYVTFYVAVDNLQAMLATAQKLGGRIVLDPSEVAPGIRIAQFEDPEGHLIGLIEQ
jgi:predicted enzyme related to lactoylglutathione lyase